MEYLEGIFGEWYVDIQLFKGGSLKSYSKKIKTI